MHGFDVVEGAFFQTVLQCRRGFVVVPAPDASDFYDILAVIKLVFVIARDGAGKDAVPKGGSGIQSVCDDAAGMSIAKM